MLFFLLFYFSVFTGKEEKCMVMLEVFATQSGLTENQFQEKFGQVEVFLFSGIINKSKRRKIKNNKRRKIKFH